MATVGTGVMVLGLLQFSAEMFGQVAVVERASLVYAIRAAFFAFLGTSTALLLAYLCRVDGAPRLAGLFNLYGVLLFFVAGLLAGSHVGGVLTILSGPHWRLPQGVETFFLAGAAALLLLLASGLFNAVRTLRRPGLAEQRP